MSKCVLLTGAEPCQGPQWIKPTAPLPMRGLEGWQSLPLVQTNVDSVSRKCLSWLSDLGIYKVKSAHLQIILHWGDQSLPPSAVCPNLASLLICMWQPTSCSVAHNNRTSLCNSIINMLNSEVLQPLCLKAQTPDSSISVSACLSFLHLFATLVKSVLGAMQNMACN